jgi:hypothetical protein
LTGEKAKFGEIEKNSFVMALNKINKAGGSRAKMNYCSKMTRKTGHRPVGG